MDGLAISPLLVTDSLWTTNAESLSMSHVCSSHFLSSHNPSRSGKNAATCVETSFHHTSAGPCEALGTFKLTQICFS